MPFARFVGSARGRAIHVMALRAVLPLVLLSQSVSAMPIRPWLGREEVATDKSGLRIHDIYPSYMADPHPYGFGDYVPGVSLSKGNGTKGFRTFVDEYGRERVFHGVNVVVKGPPWLPSTGKFDINTSLGADDFAFLHQHGVTVIRLGIMWAGAEPERGVYNMTYLQAAKDMATQASQYGIYTLLDMHQDVVCFTTLLAFCHRGSLASPVSYNHTRLCGKGRHVRASLPISSTLPE